MTGTIVKAISSFYYVEADNKIYETKVRGNLRYNNIELVTGDRVDIEVLDEENRKGVIFKSHKRENLMKRPPVANITQAILVFSVKSPDPNLSLIDRFLITAMKEHVEIIICFNKIDLDDEKLIESLKANYSAAGYPIVPVSAETGYNVEALRDYLRDNTTIVAGPSGAGKSTLINQLVKDAKLKTGEVSEKIGRGRHTTRYTELIKLDENAFIADSPGFSSIDISDIEERDLKEYFPEFYEYDEQCRFGSKCIHEKEPACRVKEAVEQGLIAERRYESYLQLLNEIRERSRRRN